ncbi:hypothetical protein C8J56DRAFT_1115063 [Mycena floridula]|nr:hypothetical protein C8J56DRAFT_1115063 [Mycena floridula]
MSEGLTVTPDQIDALRKVVARMNFAAEHGRPQPLTSSEFIKELNLNKEQEADIRQYLEQPHVKEFQKHLTPEHNATMLKALQKSPIIAGSKNPVALRKITKQNLTLEQEERIFELLEETLVAAEGNQIPPLCGYAVGFAVHIPSRSPFRVKYPSLLDAMLRFVATSRTADEILDLGDQMTLCRCDLREPVVAFLHAPASEGCGGCECESCAAKMKTWSGCLFRLLHTVLHTVKSSKLANAAMIREKRKMVKWPASASALLPSGAKQMAQACIEWLRALDETTSIQVLAHLFPLCPSLMDEWFSSRNLTQIVMDYFVSFPESLKGGVTRPEHNDDPAEAEAAALAFNSDFAKRVADMTLLFNRLLGFGSKFGVLFTISEIGKMYNTVLHLVDILPNLNPLPDFKLTIRMEELRGLGHALFRLLPDPPFTINPKLLTLAKGIHTGCIEHGDRYKVVNEDLIHFLIHPHCAHSECGETTEKATTNSSFGLCAGCKIMRYCSKDCQKAAWKDSKLPHGEICKDLGRFVEMRSGLMKKGLLKHTLTVKIVKKGGYEKRLTQETLLKLHHYLVGLDKAKEAYATKV